jgi:hypothetical protein
MESDAQGGGEVCWFEFGESWEGNWLYWLAFGALYTPRLHNWFKGLLRLKWRRMGLLSRNIQTGRFDFLKHLWHQPILDEERTNDHSQTWRDMEALLSSGKVRSIGIPQSLTVDWGVSNFNVAQLKKLLETATITPAVNQIEIHP